MDTSNNLLLDSILELSELSNDAEVINDNELIDFETGNNNEIIETHINSSIFIKKKVHIILPGGGVKGGFQAGFLYHLFRKYGHLIEIVGIDGCSVGAVNGLALLSGNIEILKDNWFSIENINDLFSPWSSKPIIGNLLNIYHAFYGMGLYNNQKLLERLQKYTSHILPKLTKSYLQKYNCVVVNVNKGSTEYIGGTHPLIYQFITASASPWIISNPMLINDNYYTDGSILDTYPLHNVEDLEADYHIVVGCDQSHIQEFEVKNTDFKNIGEYLSVLIDIMRYNSKNNDKIKDFLTKPSKKKIIPIMNTMKISLASFNPASIREGFTQGELSAEDFASIYITNF